MAVATANTAGHTKKITTNAMLLIGYCLGNFIGPFFFKTSQAPRYTLGVAMMFFCIGVQVVSLVGLGVLFWFRNRERRAAFIGDAPGNRNEADSFQIEDVLLDKTDFENLSFKVRLFLVSRRWAETH